MPNARELFSTMDEAILSGRLDDARQWREALAQDPRDPIALTLLGRLMAAEGDVIGGISFIGEALRIEPYYEPAYRYRSEMYTAIGDNQRAAKDIESLLLYYPTKSELISHYAQLALQIGRHDEAADVLKRSVRCNPGNGFFANFSGLIRQAANRLDEACAYYEHAIALDPTNAHFFNNLGTVLHRLDHFERAQSVLERATILNPSFEMAWYNLGNVHKDIREFARAEVCYRRAIELRPEYPDARLNLGCVLIQQGRWEEGWRQYEWRWRVSNLLPHPDIGVPHWRGENLVGKHLIISAEQGIGDTLQFSRYIPAAAALGARVTFICPPEIAGLMSRFAPDVNVVCNPDFSHYGGFWTPLMSLPPLLSAKLEEMPKAPYLEVDDDRILYFLSKLGKRKGKLRIGIVWGGNPQQQDDHHRSVPLEKLQKLFVKSNVRWIGLQKGGHLAELAASGAPIEDWSAELDDYDDTGALMKALDGVVSICSSPLHLAGALGVRSIAMLYWAADWRWGVDGAETPWYPTMKLCRQPSFGDWENVAEQVLAEISTWKAIPQPRSENSAYQRRPAPTVRAKTHYGIMDLFRNDTYITSSLTSAGEYCQDEINLLARYLKPGSVVIEAGANVGAHTLPTARLLGPEGRLICFEPQHEAHRLLVRNIQRAGLKQVEFYHAALGAQPGTICLPLLNYRKIDNFGSVTLGNTYHEGESVEVMTIDSLGLERCDLIKLDVEGAEFAVIEGATETIRRTKPLLYIEEQFNGQAEKLRRVLRSMDYRLYRHRALISSSGAVAGSAIPRPYTEWSASCLAVPAHMAAPIELIEYDD